jgi:uncharacterized protein with FMN-binding domain
MRRITLFFVSTVAIIVLLFSYKTSWPAPSARPALGSAAHVVSGPAVVASNSVTTSAPPPDLTKSQTSQGVTTAATTRAETHRPATKSPGHRKTRTEPKTSAASRTAASPTPNTAPVVVDGSAVDTDYGPVQVEVTIANNKIINVTVPQAPSGSGRDAEINSYALPQLVAEVLSAQSATIDGVSGATYTSQGFQASLQSALDAANFKK